MTVRMVIAYVLYYFGIVGVFSYLLWRYYNAPIKVKKGVKDLGSTIKKGWDNYEEWCKDGLEAENPSQSQRVAYAR